MLTIYDLPRMVWVRMYENGRLSISETETGFIPSIEKIRVYMVQEQFVRKDVYDAMKAERDRLQKAMNDIYDVTVDENETNHKNVRGWIETEARNALLGD